MLFLVEADGLFEGRRRIRLSRHALTHSLSACCADNDNVEALTRFKHCLLAALMTSNDDDSMTMSLLSSSSSLVDVHVFSSITQSFEKLDRFNFHDMISGKRKENGVIFLRVEMLQVGKTAGDGTGKAKNSFVSQDDESKSPRPLLALPWRESSVNLEDGSFQIHGHPLIIHEVKNSDVGTGLSVWDGSIVLARYLEQNAQQLVVDQNVLELGAGTGLVGIAAGILGAKEVILTDLEYAMTNLKDNIERNLPWRGVAKAQVLDWKDPGTFQISYGIEGAACRITATGLSAVPDLVLAADVVWIEALVHPLVQALYSICSQGHKDSSPSVLMSYQCRSTAVEKLLFDALRDCGFHITEIPKQNTISNKLQIFSMILKEKIQTTI